MLDIIVIGSGPAGVSAAVYLKRFNLDVTVISNKNSALSSAHQIDNYYGFYGVSGEELYQNGLNQLKSLDINVLNETANSPNLEEVALCRRLTLLFNPSLALCFANLYDCPSSLFCF